MKKSLPASNDYVFLVVLSSYLLRSLNIALLQSLNVRCGIGHVFILLIGHVGLLYQRCHEKVTHSSTMNLNAICNISFSQERGGF